MREEEVPGEEEEEGGKGRRTDFRAGTVRTPEGDWKWEM